MYFIVEQIDQLEKMHVQKSCFIQVISANDNYHPQLSSVSLIYYNDFKKGYVFVIDHTEGFSLDKNQVEKFINSHEKVYLLDSKYHSYFLELNNAIDLNYVKINRSGTHEVIDCLTNIHRGFYQNNSGDSWINKIIPISKHYERWECVMEKIPELLELETEVEIENKMTEAYKYVEQSGIRVNKDLFYDRYKVTNGSFFMLNDMVYNSYNLYNLTGRPTNAFNGVNFLAVPKEESYRNCFIPRNDVLVEFDFDAYHLRLISNLIGFNCPQESMHQYLGKIYFDKQELTDEEYKNSKEITFKQLYGGIEKRYSNIDFFSSLNNFIDKEWKKYNKFGATI